MGLSLRELLGESATCSTCQVADGAITSLTGGNQFAITFPREVFNLVGDLVDPEQEDQDDGLALVAYVLLRLLRAQDAQDNAGEVIRVRPRAVERYKVQLRFRVDLACKAEYFIHQFAKNLSDEVFIEE